MKFIRYCPKPAENPAKLAEDRRAAKRPADPEHPRACRVLKVEGDSEILHILDELPEFLGHWKPRAGERPHQPIRKVRLLRIAASELKAIEAEELRGASKGKSTAPAFVKSWRGR